MILSASVNADVPAQHGSWFLSRLEAGYLRVAGSDPWKQRKIVLDPEHVAGIVFWTRDVTPFLSVLEVLHRRRIAFVMQYASTQASDTTIAAMRELQQRFGPRVAVWRYDPLVLDERHSAESHLESFTRLACDLSGIVDEAVVAFAREGSGGRSQRSRAAELQSIEAGPAGDAAQSMPRRELVRRLAAISSANALRLRVCADAEALAPGSSPARCIDARRLADVAGRTIDAPTAGFMRDCLCARAIDIGDHGGSAPECFCGADPKRNVRLRHHPESEFLFEPVTRFTPARPGDLPF